MRYFLLLAALLLLSQRPVWAQTNASLSGFVNDAGTGETLLLANIVLAGTTTGTATNNSGYYTLTGLAPGAYTVICSYIGYKETRVAVTLAAGENRRLDIELTLEDIFIEGLEVTAEKEIEEEIRRIGVAQLKTDVIKQLPSVLQPDVFRSLQLLPGVKAASDYSSGLYIRGGSPDQTLILLDRTTVYNPSHFFGLFSTFNPDAIKDVRLYKGGYPAEYGGRIGSVVDIYNKDGNRREIQGNASLGLLSSRLLLEGPYAKGSWMLGVRRSTLEPLLAALKNADVDGIPDSFYFYDINGKFNFDASENDRLSLSVYTGIDALDFPIFDDADLNLNYGNRTLSTNWTHIFSQRLFSNFTFTASRYFSEPKIKFAGTPFSRINRITDLSVKGDFEFIPNERHAVSAGFWAGNFKFTLQDTFDGQESLSEETSSNYASAYVQETFRPTPQWMIRGGLRGSYFAQGNYYRLEPRIGVEYKPSDRLRLQTGYGRYFQYLTLITNESFAGFDIWLTTDTGVEPAYGDQVVAGAKLGLTESLNLDTEVYYRTMQDLFVLDPTLPDAAGLDYADLFIVGRGYAYGMEVLLERSRGRLNGFLGYTYGITRRRFSDFQDGMLYAPKYDRTHDLNLVANYDISRTWRLTGVFTYGTGQAYTEPNQQFRLLDSPFTAGDQTVFNGCFNCERLPPYHRLDLGMSKRGRFFGFADYELQMQVINVYSRRNIWFILFEEDDDGLIDRQEVPQIPIPLPNVSFTLKF